MSKPCSVCVHPKRTEIEEAMIRRQPYRQITERFGVSSGAASRHKKHIIAALARAREAREVSRADGLLIQVQDLQAHSLSILDAAEDANDFRSALSAIREARGCIELLAKLTGELQQQGTLVLVAPQWIQLRTTILNILKPYPEVQSELVQALAKLEADERKNTLG
jgi:hypothetical protein